ncbi:MAG: polyprenyl synthetase [Bacteroidetes bacterium RIFCSPLOWO2_02_FULL_36_8]|nr:MAG: polyprenyl synthetase [Bacteroidetes bacterium RIFCSPLOWO2_02_FULL_36_8]OFY70519.1 MAG: polyprenyl synthetase [Bacteroidetes bacterium RIFCSPLOWO2_12_FULL_37_12]
MSIDLKKIQNQIEEELSSFEIKFKKAMKSDVVLLDKIMEYIIKRKGKQIRPMFVFLSAKICGEVNESTYRGASLVELLHTATLVHDDVVDSSNQRRGFFSVNALWKNKVAVLVGDYLLSKGLILALHHKDYAMLDIVSNAVKAMSEGELLQIEKSRSLTITEDVYYDVIRKKTASLIASCCAMGACSAGADSLTIEKLRLFGEFTGIAFQIKDDLFDYGNSDIGKPLGIDIRERKMTLPLIYALQNATWLKKRHIINLIRNHTDDTSKVKEIIEFVNTSGGLAYASKQMVYFRDKAFEQLFSLPSGAYRSAMEELVIFTIEREK